jgi:hypothetical protein
MANPGMTRDVAHHRSKRLPSRQVEMSLGQARFPVNRTRVGRTHAAARTRFLLRRSPIPARTPANIAGMVAEIRL